MKNMNNKNNVKSNHKQSSKNSSMNKMKSVNDEFVPDERPRKDGPGGA